MKVRGLSWPKVLLLLVAVVVGMGAWLYTGQEALAGSVTVPSFKCYQTSGTPLNEPVRLFDAFHDGLVIPSGPGGEAVTIKGPHLICAPVLAKCLPGEPSCERFPNPFAGIKCYKITPSGPPVNQTITVFDQFGTEELNVGTAQFLCEPASSSVFGD